MRAQLERIVGNHSIYHARREEFNTRQTIPFRVSPEPLLLSDTQKKEIKIIGSDTVDYFHAVNELYGSDERVKKILHTDRPEIFLVDEPSRYLFIRPDLIITPKGFSISEIETSPFGLALAEILNRGYTNKGYETMVEQGTLTAHIQATTPTEGHLIYSSKTQQYAGQMTFLADEVFSHDTRTWKAALATDVDPEKLTNVYRGFYLAEYLSDPDVKALLQRHVPQKDTLYPSATPHMEEKALLSFIWDNRFQEYFKKRLGLAAFNHLREVIPPTWVVGQEEHFALGMPDGIKDSIALATLSRSKRAFVLKSSGFGHQSSWAEGVHFLHEKSARTAGELLYQATLDTSALHVVQQFTQGVKIPIQYDTQDGERASMAARIRLTPYFSTVKGSEGKLVAIKATGCENTDFIHASSASINTAVR